MIENIEKYSSQKNISRQDALQAFLQTAVLKNISINGIKLIGGTSLVMGASNPRFSEDVDLTGVSNPHMLKPCLEKSTKMIGEMLGADVELIAPKADRSTWRLTCELDDWGKIRLHIDTQPYPALTHQPLMIEYPGVSPFVFASVDVEEIMADKLIAIAFRRNLSGRDIFDIWYHWLKRSDSLDDYSGIRSYVVHKLKLRSLKQKDFLDKINSRLNRKITKRLIDEWERYLPGDLRNKELFEKIYSTVSSFTSELTL